MRMSAPELDSFIYSVPFSPHFFFVCSTSGFYNNLFVNKLGLNFQVDRYLDSGLQKSCRWEMQLHSYSTLYVVIEIISITPMTWKTVINSCM